MLRRRETARRPPFDTVADLYDRVRPGYPEEAIDDMVQLTGLRRRGRILEIGPGTGQLTVSLAERGYEITGVELGPHLAERANRNLAGYPRATVIAGKFEDAELEPAAYDVVVAATSFHWLDPATAYPHSASLLRPSGSLALLWNVHVDADQGYFAASEEIYERIAPQLCSPKTSARASDRTIRAHEIEQSGCFGEVQIRATPWRAQYSAARYLDLLSTYSDHIDLDDDARGSLFTELKRLIDTRFGGRVDKHYETVVYVAPVLVDAAGRA